jgi:peptide deformylase
MRDGLIRQTMAIRSLILFPDPLLKKVSVPVTSVTPQIRALAVDMLDTMHDAPGIGLAAIQIGVPVRIVTIDLAKPDEEYKPVIYLNPEITWSSDEVSIYDEGCLSIPEYYADVQRPARVRARYMDMDGKTHEIEASGLLATCLQHEIDHLNGVLFVDYLSKLKRDRVIKKFTKQARMREGY